MTSSWNKGGEGKKPAGEPAASVSQQRRRLIKGAAAAAPGIFTLYSGNAQAMLSTYQCIARTRDAFTGNEEFAGEEKLVDRFIRLAEGPGILVVWPAPNNPNREEKWLIEVDGAYIEAGTSGNPGTTGISWNEVISGGKEWVLQPPVSGNQTRRFTEPGTLNPQRTFVEDTSDTKPIQVLACVDDNGNVVAGSPSQCGGFTPTSGSCWASCT